MAICGEPPKTHPYRKTDSNYLTVIHGNCEVTANHIDIFIGVHY